MRILLQRVSMGQVSVDHEVIGKIADGLVLLLGVKHGDQLKDADYLIEKCLNLRIFSDAQGKMNLSVLDTKGEVLVISQFTLFADTRKGRRPGFSTSAGPEEAIPLYEYVIKQITKKIGKVETGQFGADMKVNLTNDGPVTIMIDSEDKYPRTEEK